MVFVRGMGTHPAHCGRIATENTPKFTISRVKFLLVVKSSAHMVSSWLGGSVVERRSLTGELSLVSTGPAADR